MKQLKSYFYFVIGILLGALAMYLFSNYKVEKIVETHNITTIDDVSEKEKIFIGSRIDELTAEQKVIDYLQKHHHLPEYYITKREAREQGWIASQGNLCEVLPGKAIGGDTFSNREGKLPKGKQYYEADVNYRCGRRNADRVVFTKQGEVWLTKDHYKTFDKQ